MRWQEGRAYGEAYARVKERGYSARGNEILNEQAIVLGVLLGKGAELLVLDEDEVGWQHHELTTWVLELHRPVPLLRVEYANFRAGIRCCAAYSEHRVNTTEKNTVNTAEYDRIQLNTCPLGR